MVKADVVRDGKATRVSWGGRASGDPESDRMNYEVSKEAGKPGKPGTAASMLSSGSGKQPIDGAIAVTCMVTGIEAHKRCLRGHGAGVVFAALCCRYRNKGVCVVAM